MTVFDFSEKLLFPGNMPKYGYLGPEMYIFEIYLKTNQYIFLKICMMFDNNDSNHFTVIFVYRKFLFPRNRPKYGHLGSEIDIFEIYLKTNHVFLKICMMFDNNGSNHFTVIFVYRKFLFLGNWPKYGHLEPEIDNFWDLLENWSLCFSEFFSDVW